MRLKSQFLIGLLVFAISFTIVIASVVATSIKLGELDAQQNISSDIETNINGLTYISTYYFLSQKNLTSWQTRITLIKTELSSLNSTNTQQQNLVNQVNINLQIADNIFNSYVKTIESNQINQSEMYTQFDVFWSNVSGQIQWVSFNAWQLSSWFEQQENTANQTSYVLIVTLAAITGIYFFTIYEMVFKRTLKSINSLQAKTKKISQGELKVTYEKHSKDEIGELASDFDYMIINLKNTSASKQELEKQIAERKKIEEQLLKAQSELEQYANNLEETVNQRTKKILEGEQNYRELYESFGEAFIATDWELTIIHWNKAAERVTSVKAEEALGKKVYDVFPEMASIDVTAFFESLTQKQPVRFMMNTVSRETKLPASFEVSTYPSTQGIIIIVEDKTVEEQNKRLSAIGQTAGMVGHDIRNPLQAITSDLYLIREELKEVPECGKIEGIKESMGSIEENIKYINKIVSDLQDYTRPLAPTFAEVNMKDLLQNIILSITIPKNIEVNLDIPRSLKVKTDSSYIKRIIGNLVINAVQAMPQGGKLTLKAQKIEKKVLISVKDTGVGIPQEAKAKLFNALFTTKSKGQGLGLAVVKRLVTVLKGNITFESEVGKGTEFTVELPQNN
jgi:PAS domain S-box-containing protein